MVYGMILVGDPTVLGWMTFALYLVAAVVSFRAATVIRSRQATEFSRAWSLIALGLLVLGLNKQLDLQTVLIHFAGRVAQREHFYEYRQALHAFFFVGLFGLTGIVLFRWSAKIKMFARQFRMAAIGCALVAAYILVRAASIDQVDQLLGFDLERIPCLWVLEVGGLGLVIAECGVRNDV